MWVDNIKDWTSLSVDDLLDSAQGTMEKGHLWLKRLFVHPNEHLDLSELMMMMMIHTAQELYVCIRTCIDSSQLFAIARDNPATATS